VYFELLRERKEKVFAEGTQNAQCYYPTRGKRVDLMLRSMDPWCVPQAQSLVCHLKCMHLQGHLKWVHLPFVNRTMVDVLVNIIEILHLLFVSVIPGIIYWGYVGP
jgi:hypothetical protein